MGTKVLQPGQRISGSSDARAGTLGGLFDWSHPDFQPDFLNRGPALCCGLLFG